MSRLVTFAVLARELGVPVKRVRRTLMRAARHHPQLVARIDGRWRVDREAALQVLAWWLAYANRGTATRA